METLNFISRHYYDRERERERERKRERETLTRNSSFSLCGLFSTDFVIIYAGGREESARGDEEAKEERMEWKKNTEKMWQRNLKRFARFLNVNQKT
jgi:sugar phosphate isomerase/epimerase